MVNASDSGSRGRGFEPHSGQTVLCPWARHIYSPKVLVIPRKRWLRPNMTEKLFTRTLRINEPTNQPTVEVKSLARIVDRPDKTSTGYRGRKARNQNKQTTTLCPWK